MSVAVLQQVVKPLFDLRQRQMFISVAEACEQLFAAPRLNSDCAVWCGHNETPLVADRDSAAAYSLYPCHRRCLVQLRGDSQHSSHRQDEPQA